MNTSVIIAGVILIAVILFWLFMSYNGFAKLRSSVEEAFTTLDVFLKKRHGMAGNLLKTAKEYMPDESGVLDRVTAAKELAEEAETHEEIIANENAFSEALILLFDLSEDYSDLQRNKNFISVKRQMQKVEQDIIQAGKFYNVIVKMMNNRIRALPSNLIAKLFRFKKQPVFDFLSSVLDKER